MYIYKQKFDIRNLANLEQERHRVLICEPETYLSSLYGYYLQAHNFEVKHCPYLQLLSSTITDYNPRLLLINAELVELGEGRLIKQVKRNFPTMFLVTIGYNLGSDSLKRLMANGVSSHVNRAFSRPQDVAAVIKTLLQV